MHAVRKGAARLEPAEHAARQELAARDGLARLRVEHPERSRLLADADGLATTPQPKELRRVSKVAVFIVADGRDAKVPDVILGDLCLPHRLARLDVDREDRIARAGGRGDIVL